jgi:hypothetical protein
MMLTVPHEIVEDKDSNNKVHDEGDKVYMIVLSDCSYCE